MLSVRSLMVLGVAALAAACASSGQMTAGGLARLEQTRTTRPNDPAVARSLGIAYYKAGRFADARTHLDHAVRLNPRDGTAALYLGLTAEQQKDLAGAKAAYQTYVRYGRTTRVRRQLEARLAAIARQELQLAAKAAVAQEQQLVTQQGSPTTVAVMPLRFVGADSSLRPLERGLAELITIDLSRSSQLTVVERARLQALLDEIALQSSGQTDSTTNVRAGKIIQAGRIVNGQIVQNAERLRVDAAIVNTQTALVTGGVAGENVLDQIFALEKTLVLALFDSLGVRLTTEERNAIEQRPTRSLQAFLAYSRGLALEDQGRYDEAAASYRAAVRIDPSFNQAATKQSQTAAAAVGVTLSAQSVEAGLGGTLEGSVAQRSAQGEAPTAGGSDNGASRVANNLNPSTAGGATASAGGGSGGSSEGPPPQRDGTSAGLGGETSNRTATVRVVVKIP